MILESKMVTFSLDPIPGFLLRELIDPLLRFITFIINASLEHAIFPSSEKNSIVIPKLKKHNLDPHEMKNYRPVSNSSFISKLTGRIVSEQLKHYFQSNKLFPKFQSACRGLHSTETALLHIYCPTSWKQLMQGQLPLCYFLIYQLYSDLFSIQLYSRSIPLFRSLSFCFH